jgi:mevalonate kinase
VKSLSPAASFHVVVGVLGHHGGTAVRVKAIAQQKERLGAPFDAAMRALGSAARAGIRAIASGDLETAGRAANLAHGILSGLGLVSDEMEEVVRTARNAGAIGAKMSGAGGAGGAFFGLAADIRTANDVLLAIERAGAIGFIETAAD